MNIYVGNISIDMTVEDLRDAFGAFGNVTFVQIIKDRVTGDSRMFGFVEMPNKAQAQDAIRRLTTIKGERVAVNQADPNVDYASHGGPKPRLCRKPLGRRI